MIDYYLNKDLLQKIFLEKIFKKKTKGIDKVSVIKYEKKLDENLDILIKKIKNNKYKFSPYLELLKLKGRNKYPRIISIPTVEDRIVLYIIKEILHNNFSIFVNKKLPNNYIKEIKNYILNKEDNIHYIKLDLVKYYDTIDRDILYQKIKNSLDENVFNLIKSAVETITVPNNCKKSDYHLYKNEVGIPQGLSISNILAQIYLIEFDKKIKSRSYFYERYVDDILLLSDKEISNFKINSFEKELKKIKLNFNNDKTEQNILNDKSFIFLAYEIRKDKISISERNIQIFINRIASKFTWFKNGLDNTNLRPKYLENDTEKFKNVFIEELNEKITGIISNNKKYGWIFYFSEMNDISLLFKLDKIIKSYFLKLKEFNYQEPKNLKKLVRTFFEIRNKNTKYIENYNEYNTIRKKRDFLVFRGQISEVKSYTDEEIINKFENYKIKNIQKLEKDIGYNYITV